MSLPIPYPSWTPQSSIPPQIPHLKYHNRLSLSNIHCPLFRLTIAGQKSIFLLQCVKQKKKRTYLNSMRSSHYSLHPATPQRVHIPDHHDEGGRESEAEGTCVYEDREYLGKEEHASWETTPSLKRHGNRGSGFYAGHQEGKYFFCKADERGDDDEQENGKRRVRECGWDVGNLRFSKYHHHRSDVYTPYRRF